MCKCAVKCCAWFVILLGLTVSIGWIGEYEAIVAVNEGWVTMKFTTALYFILIGVQLLMMQRPLQHRATTGLLVLSWCVLTMLCMMGLNMLSHVTGWVVNLNQIMDIDRPKSNMAVLGRPALMTTLCFLAIAAAGLIRIIRQENIHAVRTTIGVAVSVIGLVCILGYLIGNSLMIYYVPGFSSAMALHTGVGLVVAGLGLAMLRCDYKDCI